MCILLCSWACGNFSSKYKQSANRTWLRMEHMSELLHSSFCLSGQTVLHCWWFSRILTLQDKREGQWLFSGARGICKGNRFRFCFAPCTYCSRPATASDPVPTSATLACHVTRYLTRTYMYLPISVLFIISVTLYISPCPQEDPYSFLFGSPARYVHV